MYRGAALSASEAEVRALGADRALRRRIQGGARPEARRLLAIELTLTAAQLARLDLDSVVEISFDELTLRQIASVMPAAVALPLWSRGCDAVQMLHHLAMLGYAGPVHVFAPPLPDRRLVERELGAVAAQLEVHLAEDPPG